MTSAEIYYVGRKEPLILKGVQEVAFQSDKNTLWRSINQKGVGLTVTRIKNREIDRVRFFSE